jgi:hypothetical protein
MKAVKSYLYTTILPIAFLWIIGILYVKTMCHFSNSSDSADLICSLNWKDGFILFCCYTAVKVLGPILKLDAIIKRVITTVLLYCIVLALIAWPYLIASFFQKLPCNVFMHALAAIIAVEYLFWRYGVYKSRFRKHQNESSVRIS